MGLLDDFAGFIKTPEGQGLLSGVAGWAAGARRGTPINNLGRGGLVGMMGYGNALEQQSRAGQDEQMKRLREMQIQEMLTARTQKDAIQNLAKNSVMSPESQAIGKYGPTNEGATAIRQFQPSFDTQGFLSGMMGIDPMQAMQLKKSMAPVPIKIGADETLLDPNTLKPIYQGPGKDQKPLEMERMLDAAGIVDPAQRALFFAKALQKQTTHPEGVKVFNNTKDDFKNERDLRNDFQGLPTTKAFQEVQSAYDQIKVSIKQESPAGDLAAATKIMKLLDPGSVVRESELGMAMAATGLMDRMNNYVQMTMSGQKLTPAQRKDFGELAEKLYTAAEGRYNASANEYQGVAKDYGLNAGRVAKPAIRSTVSPGGWSATVVGK